MTGTEVFENTMILIDETKDNGTIDIGSTISYKNKSLRLINMLQYELYKDNSKIKTFEINLNHLEPVIGKMETLVHDKEDVILEADKVCAAYYLEARGSGKIYIEELINGIWTPNTEIELINDSKEYMICKDIINPMPNAEKTRIRCTGEYVYYVSNLALYNNKFFNSSDIPDYQENIKYELPDNFMKIKGITHISKSNEYSQLDNYKKEANKYIYLSRRLDGKAIVEYVYAPKKLETLEDELDVDDITAYSIMPYGLAAKLMLTEDKALASSFDAMYVDLKKSLNPDDTADNTIIQDVIDTSLTVGMG